MIGADQKQDGYLEGNGYLVSWCIGHLVSLADAGACDPRFKKWRYEDLPILPQEWQYIIPDDKKTQYKALGLICKVYVLSLMTDAYGDIPYNEAGKDVYKRQTLRSVVPPALIFLPPIHIRWHHV